MKNSFTFIMLAFVANVILSACNPVADDNIVEVSADANDDIVHKLVVPLNKATHEDVDQYLMPCQGKKLCVEICHRPPGNPDNSKTMTLPLNATLAHLEHGGTHHEHKDYLGPCHEEQGGDDDSGVGEDQEPGDDGGSTGEDQEPSDDQPPGDLPPWCADFQDVDADCDGYNDETGDPIF